MSVKTIREVNKMSLPIEIKREIEKISATICDKLCRFRPTCNGDFKNDKEHGKCPMDRLQGNED